MDFSVLIFAFVASTLFCIKRKMVCDCLKSVKYFVNYNTAALTSAFVDNLRKNQNRIEEYPSKGGCVAIVTGAGRGIGLEVTKGLLRCGMHVIMAVRNTESTLKVVDKLKEDRLPGSTSVLRLDVSSMESVREFVENVKSRHPAVHLLVNNAGVLMGPYRKTDEGFEYQLATNYVGHFYLTHLLMDNLVKGGEESGKVARVVNVSSCAHFGIHMFFEDFHMENSYNPFAGYARSKLAQILSTRYLNKKFENDKIPVRMYAVHPGVVATDMFYNAPTNRNFRWMGRFFKTVEQGAVTVLYCAISADMENRGGAYMSNCAEGYSTPYSKNQEKQEKLYSLTCKLLMIKEFGLTES